MEGLSTALRAQEHEFSNRLHVLVRPAGARRGRGGDALQQPAAERDDAGQRGDPGPGRFACRRGAAAGQVDGRLRARCRRPPRPVEPDRGRAGGGPARRHACSATSSTTPWTPSPTTPGRSAPPAWGGHGVADLRRRHVSGGGGRHRPRHPAGPARGRLRRRLLHQGAAGRHAPRRRPRPGPPPRDPRRGHDHGQLPAVRRFDVTLPVRVREEAVA